MFCPLPPFFPPVLRVVWLTFFVGCVLFAVLFAGRCDLCVVCCAVLCCTMLCVVSCELFDCSSSLCGVRCFLCVVPCSMCVVCFERLVCCSLCVVCCWLFVLADCC